MSDTYTTDADGKPSLTRAFTTMPAWKVAALVVSLLVGAAALTTFLTTRNHREAKTVMVQQTVPNGPPITVHTPGGNGFVGGGETTTTEQPTKTVTTPSTPPPSLMEQYTPTAAKIGFSFFVGLVAGTISRVFLKFAAAIAALIVAGIAGAHYFNINIDLSHVQGQTGQATTWVQGQLYQLWDAVKAHLPSAGAGTAGFLIGLKRR